MCLFTFCQRDKNWIGVKLIYCYIIECAPLPVLVQEGGTRLTYQPDRLIRRYSKMALFFDFIDILLYLFDIYTYPVD